MSPQHNPSWLSRRPSSRRGKRRSGRRSRRANAEAPSGPLTATDQLSFDTALAGIAHAHGLSVGLKNDLDQLVALQGTFDFAINEQCAQYTECNAYDAWAAAGKAVVEVEYRGRPPVYCADAAAHHRDAIHKSLALTAAWRPCR